MACQPSLLISAKAEIAGSYSAPLQIIDQDHTSVVTEFSSSEQSACFSPICTLAVLVPAGLVTTSTRRPSGCSTAK